MIEIWNFLEKQWPHKEKPKAFIRNWDSESAYKDKDYSVEIHEKWYRSIHYIIETSPTKKKFTAEIQVRTIFEEWWSEIDHDICYPYNLDNPILNWYLYLFNWFAWIADEMWSHIKDLQCTFLEQEKENNEKDKLIKKQWVLIKELEKESKQTRSRNKFNTSISKLSKNYDALIEVKTLNKMNTIPDFSISELNNYSRIWKKCDRCNLTQNDWRITSFAYLNSSQFNNCPSCNRCLCSNCWPQNWFPYFSVINRQNNFCPDCRKETKDE